MEQFEFLTLLDEHTAQPPRPSPPVLPFAKEGDSMSSLDALTDPFDDFSVASW